MSPHILIVDDDPGVRTGLTEVCRAHGHSVEVALSGGEALEMAAREQPDVVLLDVQMPDRGGLDVLPELVAMEGSPSVVMMTGLADVSTAVESMKLGAVDFLEKPVQSETLEGLLKRVSRHRALKHERDNLRTKVSSMMSGPIIGESRCLMRLLDQVHRVASTPRTTVLILGESGVGKELIAREIHAQSARSELPFIAVNCATLSESLLEAELFGYEAGSFTGASSKGREGLFSAAEGGSLFLDEIGELELPMQARLLRVLQERAYRRVGGNSDRTADVRIIASTNRDLESMVEDRRFREDLFYRLNVMTLRVPALRERIEDVTVLANHFLATFAQEFGRSFDGFSQCALERLEGHHWPGNVRELHNTIERAALLNHGGSIELGDLSLIPQVQDASDEGAAFSITVSDYSIKTMEEALIRRVLEATEGNRSQAARLLGVNRTTLYNKLRLYAIGS